MQNSGARCLAFSAVISLALAGTGKAFAATAVQLADINQSRALEGSSLPQAFAPFQNQVFFAAQTEEEGDELWKTDGTSEGTVPVLDIRPGPTSSHPRHLNAVNGALYFVADDGSSGPQLWRTDGTPQGTSPAPPLIPGAKLSFERLDNIPGSLLLLQKDGLTTQLWRSDGTPEGTHSLWSGSGSGNLDVVGTVVPLANALVFATSDNCRTCTPTLWRANETGSIALFQGAISQVTAAGGAAYFAGQKDWQPGTPLHLGLWKTDGTAAGTVEVKDFGVGSMDPSQKIASVGGKIVFSASDTGDGYRLWSSDGTGAGTTSVAGVDIQNPSELTQTQNSVFYVVNGASSQELWKTDGTGPGTSRVFSSGSSTSTLRPTAFQGYLLFSSLDDAQHLLLRRVNDDGKWVVLGTFLPSGSTAALSPTPIGAIAYFSADTGSGLELWATDGTPEGTRQVKDIWPASTPSNPHGFSAAGHGLVLSADDGTGGRAWVVDNSFKVSSLGSTVGTLPSNLTSANGLVYFTQRNSSGAVSLWQTDGTEAGTILVRPDLTDDEVCTGVNLPPCSGNLTAVGPLIYFTDWVSSAGPSPYEFRLWSTDGTRNGTGLVRGGFYQPLSSLSAGGGSLYFGAAWGQVGLTLSRSDATGATTQMVKDLVPPYGSGVPQQLTWVNDTLFFLAYGPNTQHPVLWKSDGTDAGTEMVMDLSPTTPSPVFQSLTRVGNRLFFTANDGTHGWELWISDGSQNGTRLVKDIAPGPSDASPSFISDVGGVAFFWANDHVHGWELWKSDGTEPGTNLIRDILPGPTGAVGAPGPIVAVGSNTAVFAASDGVSGFELWKSDGTPDGTVLAADIAPGPRASSPSEFALFQGTVFFQADNGVTGKELWSIPLAELGNVQPLPTAGSMPGTSNSTPTLHSRGCQTAGGAPLMGWSVVAFLLLWRRRVQRG